MTVHAPALRPAPAPPIAPPRLEMPPLADMAWRSAADMIRFRADARPAELLERPAIVARFGKRVVALLADAPAAHEALVTRAAAFPKAKVQTALGRAAFGPGISGVDGAENTRQRQALAWLTAGGRNRGLGAIAAEAAEDAILRWRRAGRIDLYREMSRLALQIVWAGLFGDGRWRGVDPAADMASDRLRACRVDDFVGSAQVMRDLARHFETSGRWRMTAADNPLRAIASPDGLTGDAPLSQEELRANAVVFAASGHVTTGLAMAWTAWLLAGHPADQDRVADEIAAARRSPWLRAAMSEALRLMPPGAEVMRDAREPLRAGDRDIPAGALVLVSIYALHRGPARWEAPDDFRPGRFGPGAPRPVPGAYLPFSGGDQGCPGAGSAWAEALPVLTRVFARLHLSPGPGAAATGLAPGACIYPDRPLIAEVAPR